MRTILLLLLFLSPFLGKSQDRDAAFWPGVKIRYNYTERLAGSVFIQDRIQNNYSKQDNLFIEYCSGLKVSKHFDLEAAYVFVDQSTVNNRQSIKHQFYVDVNAKYKLYRKIYCKYTSMFQIQWADMYSNPMGLKADKYLRNKVAISYKLKKRIEPFLFIEFRTKINRTPYYFNRIRYSGGSTFHFPHKIDLDIYYMMQHVFHESTPEHLYIFGITFCKEI